MPFARLVACPVFLLLVSVGCDSVRSVLVLFALAREGTAAGAGRAGHTSAAIAAAVRGSLFAADGEAPSVRPSLGVGEYLAATGDLVAGVEVTGFGGGLLPSVCP